jgi:uncharacterized protein YdhG (YjbR/CyaY superfamily)
MTRMKKRKPGLRARGSKGGRVVAKKRRGGGVAAGARRGAVKIRRASVPKSVEEYLAGVREPARSVLREMRQAIRSVLPAQAREIIRYRIPGFRHGPVLLSYAAFAEHCSLFPTAAAIEDFKGDLKGYTTSKGTIQFPIGEPLPVALIKRIVKARVAAAAARGK